MRVIVCGSRHWTDREAIRRELALLPSGSVILHGDNGSDARGRPLWGECDSLAVRGADKLSGQVARELGLGVEIYTPPEWLTGERDNTAGPKRNSRMLKEGKPDLVLAFTSNLARSAGTADMVRKAQKAGVEVRLIAE
jgi:hypothetical protein